MICPCIEPNKQAPIQAKRGDPVADAFFGFWRSGMDRFPNFLKSTAMIVMHARKVPVNRFWFCLP